MNAEFFNNILDRISKLAPICWVPLLFITIAIIYLFIKIIHTLYLMRPISEKEIEKWAKQERLKEAEDYFRFDLNPPKALRKIYEEEKPPVDPEGSELGISIPFRFGPTCIAYWLKGKHHQWVIAMYSNNKSDFTRIYGNKGPDKKSVECLLKPNYMFGKGKRNNFNTILLFHNHPMSIEPQLTEEDKIVALERKRHAKINDWNYLEFICVRGTFRLFESHYSRQFKSIEQYKTEFHELKKRGALANLKFRWEKYY
jgi:hypothetical protein